MAQEPQQLQEMSFWDHIDALRSVLIRIVIALVVVTVGLFCVMPTIFDSIILAPCHGDFLLYRLFEKMTSSVSWLPQFTTQGFEVELINTNNTPISRAGGNLELIVSGSNILECY